MKKFFRIFGISLLILLLLLVITPWMFKDRIAGLVRTEINKQVNASIDFKGASLSLLRSFPDFSLKLNGLSVINKSPFEGDTLAYLGSLGLTVDLMSVISGGPYVIERIALDKMILNLITLKSGEVNWDIALPEEEPSVAEEPQAGEGELNVKLRQFLVSGSNIRYDDQSLGMIAVLNGLNVKVSGDFTANEAQLQTALESERLTLVYDGINYLNNVRTSLQLGLQTNLEQSIYSFNKALLSLNNVNLHFDGSIEMPSDDILIQLTFDAPDNSFKNLLSLVPAVFTAGFEKLSANGEFSLSGFVKGTYNEQQMPGFGVNLQINNGSIAYPDLPAQIKNIAMNGSVANENGDPDATIVRIRNFGFELAGNPFAASLLLKTPVSDPDIDATFKGTIDLNSLKNAIPLEQGDQISGIIKTDFKVNAKLSDAESKRYESIDASGNLMLTDFMYQSKMFELPVLIRDASLTFSPAAITMQRFQANIGSSDVSLNGTIENYLSYYLGDGTLNGKLSLTSGLLDVNQLMSSLPSDSSAAETADTTMSLPELPERIDFAFDGKIDRLLYQTYDLSKVETRLTYKDKRIVFDPLKALMMGGSISMKGSFDAADKTQALIGFDMDLAGIDIPSAYRTIGMFSKAAPIAEKSSGNMSTTFSIRGVLDQNMNPVFSSLAGGGSLRTSQLVVESSRTMSSIASALGNESFSRLKTDALNLAFEFLNGRVYQKPFQIKYAGSDVTIGGWIDFEQNIEYDLLFKLPFQVLGGQVASGIDKLAKESGKAGVSINPGSSVQVKAKLSGTANNPRIELDYKSYASDLKAGLEDLARKEIEKQKEELKKQVKEEASKILEDARRQADELYKQAEASAARIRAEAATLAAKTQSEANKQADNLIAEGKKKGMVAEMAAKEAAKKVRKEGDDSAARIVSEADRKATSVITQAKSQGDEIIRKAQERSDKL
jgi:uncharacterized protein involved in outer membrane biogenesis/vacuolar-type H+-ATPase subunit H